MKAQLFITDMTGRTVKQVEIIPALQGEINITSENMVSGTYIYNLVVDGELTGTGKMVVVK